MKSAVMQRPVVPAVDRELDLWHRRAQLAAQDSEMSVHEDATRSGLNAASVRIDASLDSLRYVAQVPIGLCGQYGEQRVLMFESHVLVLCVVGWWGET
jgi:hypothetical protein